MSKPLADELQTVQPCFIEKEARVFELNDENLHQKLGDYEALEKNKVAPAIYDFVESRLKGYYGVYYYSTLPSQNENVILYAHHDYYRDFILITFIDGKPFDAKVIATISGDGGDFYIKSSEVKQDYIESKFEEGYESFTEPIDTIYYKLLGTSKIYINHKSQIKEDTLKVTRDSVSIKRL